MKRSADREKNPRQKHGIRTYVWVYFIVFTVFILLLIWIFQYGFLANYYRAAKVREISSSANKIIEAYDTEFQTKVNRAVAFENGFCIVITDGDGNVLTMENNLGSYSYLYKDMEEDYSMYIYQLKNDLEKAEENYITRSFDNSDTDHSEMIYAARIYTKESPTQAFLFIECSVDPIDSTVRIVREQLIYITIIIFELGFIVTMFISKRVSRPIVSITETAKDFGAGNYEAEFQGEGYREIEELAEVLNSARDEIRKVSDLRRELIANISHDLRTPLTMIRGYAEMIRDLSGDIPEKREAHLQVIIDESDRLSQLVNDLLELSKLESGNIELDIRSFSITENLRDCMRRYDLMVEQNGYDIAFEPDEDRQVLADPDKLDQVVYNFINNAINYTPDHKVIRLKQINLEKSVRVEVSDNGPGISKELLPKVFDRYYRGDRVKRDVVGTGLGLSICKEILRRHDFAFGVRSDEGEGSTFWFEVPVDGNASLSEK